jgi:PAS domain S-box-containing protein
MNPGGAKSAAATSGDALKGNASKSSWLDPRWIETSFWNVLESTPDAMLLVDTAGKIVLVNRQAEVLFGYPRQELLGRPVETLLPHRYRHGHIGHRARYAEHPHTRAMGAGLDLYGLRRDGSEFPVEISLSPIETGESTLVMSAIRDVSDRKRFERQLQEKNRALEVAYQELEAFSYSISHDLRAPVRAMRGFARILAEELPEEISKEARHCLERIENSAERMSQLIDGLLSLARLARQPLARSRINPSLVAQEVLNELRAELKGRAVDIQIEAMPVCEADPTLVHQIYVNLLSNALKYTRNRNPAVIRVSALSVEGSCVYQIEDNGAGFDMRHAGKLFRVFQRLHHAAEFEGIGVGLALVQQIVQRHGGRVWAEAKPNRGATFSFTLSPPPEPPTASGARSFQNPCLRRDFKSTGALISLPLWVVRKSIVIRSETDDFDKIFAQAASWRDAARVAGGAKSPAWSLAMLWQDLHRSLRRYLDRLPSRFPIKARG